MISAGRLILEANFALQSGFRLTVKTAHGLIFWKGLLSKDVCK